MRSNPLALSLLTLVLSGCGSSRTSSPTVEPVVAPPPTTSAAAGPSLPTPTIAALPTGTSPTPTSIVIVSDARQALSIETTFGALESVSIASLDTPLGVLDADSEDVDGGYPRACACPCGGPCAECERPMGRSEALAPGARVTLAWNGLLRRYRSDARTGSCFESFAPAPGRYLVRVCTGRPIEGEPGPCGSAEVTLPSSTPITIHVGARESLACPLEPALLERAARAALSTMERNAIVPDRIAACRPVASCHAESDLAYGEDVIRGAAYTRERGEPPPPPGTCVLVAPRGDQLLTRVFLPLPDGMQGGERFDHVLDASATRILSVRYEQ
ncbi:MAG: hypothetical protein K1X94_00750 [Sandaracinaceae bacterium]|nr:hypothetical protein [Sandaracinaceae bacterium]